MENVSIGAVRNAICKYGEEASFQDNPKSGRKPGSVNRNLDRKVKQSFRHKKGASVRDVAKKIGTSKSYVQRVKARVGLWTYKKQKKPKNYGR